MTSFKLCYGIRSSVPWHTRFQVYHDVYDTLINVSLVNANTEVVLDPVNTYAVTFVIVSHIILITITWVLVPIIQCNTINMSQMSTLLICAIGTSVALASAYVWPLNDLSVIDYESIQFLLDYKTCSLYIITVLMREFSLPVILFKGRALLTVTFNINIICSIL